MCGKCIRVSSRAIFMQELLECTGSSLTHPYRGSAFRHSVVWSPSGNMMSLQDTERECVCVCVYVCEAFCFWRPKMVFLVLRKESRSQVIKERIQGWDILLAQMCLINHFPSDLIKHLLPSITKLLTSAPLNELERAPALDGFNSGRQDKYNVLFHVFCHSSSSLSFLCVDVSLSVCVIIPAAAALLYIFFFALLRKRKRGSSYRRW